MKINVKEYDGSKVKTQCKITSNGKIYCYCIPLSWLNNEGDLPDNLQEVKEREYQNYKKRFKSISKQSKKTKYRVFKRI